MRSLILQRDVSRFCESGTRFGSTGISCLVAGLIAIGMTVGSAAEKEAAPAVKGEAAAAPVDGALPDFVHKLDLSAKQVEQIKEISREYDGSIAKVWKQFSDRYMKTITTETSLLAAIEDNLTEAQRTHVREQRHKTAQHEKLVAGEKVNPETAKPVDQVKKEADGVGVPLTAEQEAMSDKVQENYRPQMRALSREVQALHFQLLSLEADKLVAIEKVLTKDQLAQLRSLRQKPISPAVHKGK